VSRGKSSLHLFRGEKMTLVEIAKATGFSIWTIRRRAGRGIPFDKPVRQRSPDKPKEPKLWLTGDMHRDLKAIIATRHRDVIRRHAYGARCELCA
jgi:hypothetical protein